MDITIFKILLLPIVGVQVVAPISFLFLDRSFRFLSVASLGIKVGLPLLINILMILR